MSDMPLTDGINALIRYANETTGASDTTLSDAVESLVAGYGGGGGGFADWLDFSAGNIQALIAHGSEYIMTDYMGTGNEIFGAKFASSEAVRYEHFWGMSFSNNKYDMQRSNASWNIDTMVRGTASIDRLAITSGTPFVKAAGALGYGAMTPTKALAIFAGYYNNNLESQLSKATFYGLNLVNANGEYIARFMPWLENGTPCVKDLISGSIYYNAGTGAFGYIDAEGVTHD